MKHKHNYSVGDRIKFFEEKQSYKIQACNERFLICNKPFNLKHTVLYTVVDLEKNIRGTENLIFGMGAETKEECEEMLERLATNQSEVSHRNNIELKIMNAGETPAYQ